MILLEDGPKIVRQPQRRLNPLILDVVKKEVTKHLQADIIYPISDSYFKIHIAQEDKEKTTLTCLFVFMDDFTLYGSSFDACLNNLNLVLERCIKNDLVLNYEKCHFMVEHGIVLGHIISKKGISVDLAKVDIIFTLPYPSCIREIRSFLGHAGPSMTQIHKLKSDAKYYIWDDPYLWKFGSDQWVEAIPTRTNDSRVVAYFVRSNIFCRFGIP
ncbi:uncharacterized protein LOC127104061 [Lathyrus oleraceus]|uniref:uncharacterized protein LOC127104061 n=1 Tax=Pisum sativum TaxID=3888 RepID=UPI0021CF02F7|nr:uncharacterized protein LOC127104061 [Pisum sativum]